MDGGDSDDSDLPVKGEVKLFRFLGNGGHLGDGGDASCTEGWASGPVDVRGKARAGQKKENCGKKDTLESFSMALHHWQFLSFLCRSRLRGDVSCC